MLIDTILDNNPCPDGGDTRDGSILGGRILSRGGRLVKSELS
jgi:hypothetical protein